MHIAHAQKVPAVRELWTLVAGLRALCATAFPPPAGGILRHIGLVHAHKPYFHIVCGINGCPCMYRNYNSFRKHLRRKHPCTPAQEDEQLSIAEPTVLEVPDDDHTVDTGTATSEEQSKLHAAMFILKTKEVNGVSQTATNELLQELSSVVQMTVNSIKVDVCSILRRHAIDAKVIGEVSEVFQKEHLCDPFRGLHSEFLQKQTFKEMFGLVVSIDNCAQIVSKNNYVVSPV